MGCFFSKRRKQAKEAKAGAESGDRNGSLSAEADKQPQYSWDQRAKVTAISSFESGCPWGGVGGFAAEATSSSWLAVFAQHIGIRGAWLVVCRASPRQFG